MGRWDRLTQTRKRLALEAEYASFRYRREWAGYRGGYLHLEELQNLSNSTLHNTAGRTQAVNISAVQRMVGWKKEEDSEQKKQRGWKLENRSGVAKLRTENSRPTGSPYLIRTYMETSSSSSSCTCGYRSNPEGVATTAAPLCGGLLIGVTPPFATLFVAFEPACLPSCATAAAAAAVTALRTGPKGHTTPGYAVP
ncbi:hypothetical protein ALC53_02763 [Atta colombica]|uniref:Uncharacterized protein n=1 Tax=Atta colombica TaxID=520822 RepID=A0A195BQP2_9HYME|nr:hypothetical protein ALC53_02763 [Atta colombica]